MKIGLLAYHAACNFGAFLQLLSTVEYIKKQGDEPMVINWIPKDFSKDYEKRSLLKVRDLYGTVTKHIMERSMVCFLIAFITVQQVCALAALTVR